MASSRDDRCVRFLQAVLPELGYRWPGFRKVRRQVCRRIVQRLAELELGSFGEYRAHLRHHAPERRVLDRLLRVTISRFFRDRHLWRVLGDRALPILVEGLLRGPGSPVLRAWSAGCASGEEAHSLCLLWRHRLPPRVPAVAEGRLTLRVLATDLDLHMLRRARRAIYPRSCLEQLPDGWIEEDFEPAAAGEATGATEGDGHREPEYRLDPAVRRPVRPVAHDVRSAAPLGPFHLLFCRNLAFTYFSPAVQRRVLGQLLSRLAPGGLLVVGGHEEPPATDGLAGRLVPWPGERRLLRWCPESPTAAACCFEPGRGSRECRSRE